MTYILGRRYKVPTIRVAAGWHKGTWPVLGPLHEDVEIIGFPLRHWHLDPRFMSGRQVRRHTWPYGWKQLPTDWSRFWDWPLSVGVSSVPTKHDLPYTRDVREGRLNEDTAFADFRPLPEVVLRWRRCYREMPPYVTTPPSWLKELEAAYEGERVRHDAQGRPICPHRGLPLDGIPCDPDGAVTCRGHGLHWDLTSGRLVKIA